MSNNNDQDSLQPSLSGQLDAPSSKSIINENWKQICRDFIWGLCNKGAQCKYRHELDFEAMKKTLKFCHDYQNPSGCMREHCTYLHTSKEEESLFFATRTLPRVLAERHANITEASAEAIPQIALFIQESLVGAPPPPPPSASVAAPSSPLNPRSTMPLQQLPPPPPPPPPPNTKSTNTVQTTSLFTVPPPQPTPAFSITQPPPPLPVFDASRLPPPIPAMVQPQNTTQKRQATNDSHVSPGKLRKTEEPKPDDALCDVCVQREIRIEKYRQDMEKMSTEDEYQTLLYKKKLMEYQKQKDILRKLINNDYKFVQEFLDDVPQYALREPLSNLNPSFHAGMSTTGPKHNHQQFLLQFMEYMFSNTRSFESKEIIAKVYRRMKHEAENGVENLTKTKKEEREAYSEQKEMSTVQKLKEVLMGRIGFDSCIETLRTILRESGYEWSRTNDNRKILAEKHDIQILSFKYLENLKSRDSSSVCVEESLRTLSTTPRRSSHQSPDIMQTLKDILGHATSSERSVSSELSVENTQSSGANGVSSYRRYSNGQRVEMNAPPPAAPLPPPANAPAPLPPATIAPPAPLPAVPYSHYPPPYLPAPRAPTPRAPLPPYYHYQ